MHQVEQQLGIVKGLAGLAEMAAAQEQAERAGRLFGPASRLLPATSSYREEVHRWSAVLVCAWTQRPTRWDRRQDRRWPRSKPLLRRYKTPS
jgi:hypothetical protein